MTARASIARRPDSMTDLPLSAHQHSWWAMCTRYPRALTPILALVHRLRGPLERDAWLRAVGALVDRQESLRIRFVRDPRTALPRQVVDPPRGLDVECLDLSDLPAGAREERARALLDERRRRPLDLVRDPLVASCLLRLAADDHVWMLAVHHILADGASMAIAGRDLGEFYRAFVAGTEPALPPLPTRYGDYLAWQQTGQWQQAAQRRHAEDRRYWARRLAGAPRLELRTDLPRPAPPDAPAAQLDHAAGVDLARRVAELARSERCTPYVVLLAALQILLVRHSGQRDFCIGVPVLGRHARAELRPVIGLFSNLVTLRCDLSGDSTFRALLAGTRRSVVDALRHQELPFSQVVPYLDVPPDDGLPQVFQVLFDFYQPDEVRLPGLRVQRFPLGAPKSVHDVVITASIGAAGLRSRFIYNSALFTAGTLTAMASGLEQVLRAGVTRPDSTVSALVTGCQTGPIR